MDARIAPPFMEATDASRLVCVVVVSYQEYSLTQRILVTIFTSSHREGPRSKSSRKGIEGSNRGSQPLNVPARPLKTDSGKHFFGTVAARRAQRAENRKSVPF